MCEHMNIDVLQVEQLKQVMLLDKIAPQSARQRDCQSQAANSSKVFPHFWQKLSRLIFQRTESTAQKFEEPRLKG